MDKQPVLRPGTIIADRYRIDKAIARGGCSIVYKGTHIDMERPVALKLMSSLGGTVDRAWVERFKREAQLASQLHHPNTITIFDYGTSKSILFIAMEWVEGDSLRNVIREQGAIEPRRVATLIRQMLESLMEAHDLQILHRDLKPSNIMITKDINGVEQVKVLDFGLAKAQDYNDPNILKLTKDGDFVGTPRYASPEQLRGRPLSTASDIYGVGMVMWEMLAGLPAVPDVDFGTCVQHHLGAQEWKLPTSVSCPFSLAVILEKALLKKQNARFQTCQEMISELELWLEEEDNPRAMFGNQGLLSNSEPLNQAPETFSPLTEITPPPMVHPVSLGMQKQTRDDIFTADTASSIESPRPNTPANTFDASGELELDRTVRQPTAPSRPIREQPLPDLSENESNDLIKKGVIGAVFVIFLIVGVWGLGQVIKSSAQKDGLSNPDMDVVDDVLNKTTPTTSPKVVDKRTEPSVESSKELYKVVLVLRRADWDIRGDLKPLMLDGWSQTTIRVKREVVGADLIIYQCNDKAIADSIETNAEDKKSLLRLNSTMVVKIFPLLKNDTSTLKLLKSTIGVLK